MSELASSELLAGSRPAVLDWFWKLVDSVIESTGIMDSAGRFDGTGLAILDVLSVPPAWVEDFSAQACVELFSGSKFNSKSETKPEPSPKQ